jgi:RNA polymerase sigma factor (sigma-70 family)
VRTDADIEDLLHSLAPQVLGALIRRYRQFDACEDAVQEALLAAAIQWPDQGAPENPRGWLITVASRRMTDELRSEHARRRREDTAAARVPLDETVAPAPGDEHAPDEDDTLTLLFLCCHPELSAPSQIALTLRAVGGLTTAQIASAFLVPEATMAQRISRAKQRIKATGITFDMPPDRERGDRLRAVLHVLYLIFNEGYTASSGPDLQRGELTGEAIRLAREVRRLLPQDGEVAGLLALMLLTDARRPARTEPDGALIPLADQDRERWNREYIQEGVALITDALARAPLGPYQLQAAIAAVHAEAPRAQDTDWPQILALYELLERIAPNPMVTLNHAVAVAMVKGPRAGLDLLGTLDGDERLAGHHRLAAVRAHLLEMAGDDAAAYYRLAARRTTSLPEQRYLTARAARLTDRSAPAGAQRRGDDAADGHQYDAQRGDRRHERVGRVGLGHEQRPAAEHDDDARRDAPVITDDEVPPEAREGGDEAH